MTGPFPSSVAIETEADIRLARKIAREVIEHAGLGEREEVRLLTIVSELTRNILKYAGSGTCAFEILRRGARVHVKCTCSDQGSGIDDLEAALTDGYSTGATLGVGLPGVMRISDNFQIKSSADGTVVEAVIHAHEKPTTREAKVG